MAAIRARAASVTVVIRCHSGASRYEVAQARASASASVSRSRLSAAECGWSDPPEPGRNPCSGGRSRAWALVALGTAYAAWGVRHAVRSRAGIVPHDHHGHLHLHAHGDVGHDHAAPDRSQTTFWALFTVFVLGPCEPLIPLFVLPASRGRWGAAAATAVVFSIVTIATMVTLVSLAVAGARRLPLAGFERWSHAFAGGVIACSGLAVIFLGL